MAAGLISIEEEKPARRQFIPPGETMTTANTQLQPQMARASA